MLIGHQNDFVSKIRGQKLVKGAFHDHLQTLQLSAGTPERHFWSPALPAGKEVSGCEGVKCVCFSQFSILAAAVAHL